ncbi:hypothetical protein RhiirA1_461687 [Rhizophagus irregularis]|uniref:Uncharacterized protein n=1 Tax=Rhizophagus irregularis TaxID=588596 RepID=A0A2N0RNW2_9GLOM|nr:hypothetical protein RhiirA1_461687 [Rhizophagus irregularis]
MEETLKQYMNEYYRGFTGFGIEHIYDFARCITYYKRISLEEYEKKYLDEDILFPPGNIKIGIRDERNDRHMHMNENILIDFAVFTMKLGGETIKRILEKILLGISIEGAVKEGAAVDVTKTSPVAPAIFAQSCDRFLFITSSHSIRVSLFIFI